MDPSSNMTDVFIRRGRHHWCSCTEERPCEDTARRGPPASQEEASAEAEFAGTWIMDFRPPELCKINACRVSHPAGGILYGRQSRLTQLLRKEQAESEQTISIIHTDASVLSAHRPISVGTSEHKPCGCRKWVDYPHLCSETCHQLPEQKLHSKTVSGWSFCVSNFLSISPVLICLLFH